MLKSLNFWKEVRTNNRQYKASWKGINVLAILYFIQLSSYRLIGLYGFSDAAEKVDSQWIQIIGSLVGAIGGAVWLYWYRNKYSKKRNSIKILLRLSLLSFIIGVMLLLSTYLIKGDTTLILYLGQFFFGAGWACGIGGSILWCCEFLSPYLRTLGALFIGCAGFGGAGLIAFFQSFIKFDFYTIGIFTLIYLTLSFWVFKSLPRDAKLTHAFYHTLPLETISFLKVLGKKGWLKFKNLNYLGIVIISLFLATSVQYSVFFLQNIEKMSGPSKVGFTYEEVNLVEELLVYQDSLEKKNQLQVIKNKQELVNNNKQLEIKPRLFVVRYFGFFLGAYLIFYLNWLWKKGNRFFRSRILTLATLQFLQFLTFCIPLIIWSFDSLFKADFLGYSSLLYGIAFLSGVCAPIWILSLLAIAEQFSLKARVFWIIVAPTAYRGIVSAILLFRTEASDSVIYSGDKTFGVLMWGAIFTFIGFTFSLLLKERFEKDPSPIKDDDVISNASIRNTILHPPSDTERKNESYLAFANEALGNHFIEVLKTQMYFSSIYIRGNNTVKSLNFIQNPNTFNAFNHGSNSNKDEYLALQLISDLIEKEALIGLINELEIARANDNAKINGAVLWHAPKPYSFPLKDYENYRIINIEDQMTLSTEDLQALVNVLEQPYETRVEQQQKQVYFRDFAKKMAKGNTRHQKEILLYLILRADVERFKYGHYFLHIILPYTLDNQVSLVLKTSERFISKRLEELRSLISFVENVVVQKKRLIKLGEQERLKGIFYRNHSDFFRDRMETHFIGDILELPKHYLSKYFSNNRSHPIYKAVSDFTTKSKKLFKKLHSTNSLIELEAATELCQQYLGILETILKKTRNEKFTINFTTNIISDDLLAKKIPSFIIINLIHNSVKYCVKKIMDIEESKRTYNLEIGFDAQVEKESLVIELWDNGTGFSEEVLTSLAQWKTKKIKAYPKEERKKSTFVTIDFLQELETLFDEQIDFLHLNRYDALGIKTGAKVVLKLPFSCIEKYSNIPL